MNRRKVQQWLPGLCMKFFFALEMAPTTPRLWKKYVDDTFCILRKGSAEELLRHLIGVMPTIKFIVDQAAWT